LVVRSASGASLAISRSVEKSGLARPERTRTPDPFIRDGIGSCPAIRAAVGKAEARAKTSSEASFGDGRDLRRARHPRDLEVRLRKFESSPSRHITATSLLSMIFYCCHLRGSGSNHVPVGRCPVTTCWSTSSRTRAGVGFTPPFVQLLGIRLWPSSLSRFGEVAEH
jgi:hypothetical protein